MPLRAAAICGLAAPVSFVAGVVLADVAQPAAFSPVNDDISDLGALTASSPWLYNQVAANLTGILVIGFALGLWAALGSGFLSRAGVLGLVVVGAGMFLDGLFRLDCQGIDAGCDNTSWHSSAHKIESGITAAALLLTPLVLAFAFRRLPAWRRLWLPTLLATPALIATSAAFSAYGPGVASRAGSAVWFLWLALVAFHLLRASVDTAPVGCSAAARLSISSSLPARRNVGRGVRCRETTRNRSGEGASTSGTVFMYYDRHRA